MARKSEDDKGESGHWGKFQMRLSILLILSTIPNGLRTAVVVFTSSTPDHRCYIPELDGDAAHNSTVDENMSSSPYGTTTSANPAHTQSFVSTGVSKDDLLEQYIPMETVDGKSQLSKCKMFNTSSLPSGNLTDTIIKCQHGWIYDKRDNKETAVTEWDLVCDNAWIKPATSSASDLGAFVAPLLIGWASDRYGRKMLFLITTFAQYIFTFVTALSINPLMYGVSTFLCGFFSLCNFMSAVVIGSEMLGPRERAIVGNLEMTSFAVGYMLMPLLAFITPSWRWLLVTMACPLFFYVPYCWLIPESYKWLVQRGHFSRAKRLLREIAEYNGISSDDSVEMSQIQGLLRSEKNEERNNPDGSQHASSDFRDLFRHKFILKRILICSYAWLCVCTAYVFFGLNTGNLGGDDYINCFLAAAVEIPASLASLFFMNNAGRRPCYFILMFTAAFSIALTPFALQLNHAVGITVAMIGKLALTAAYDAIYLYTPEMFPTLLRYRAVGISSTVGNIGAISSAYIVYLGEQVNASLPYLFMGIFAAISALSVLLLPETKGVQVPNTIEEAKSLKTSWTWKCSKSADA